MQTDADYIVVGSGAGGGTVAARLAEAGYTVVLLEAGGDPKALGGDPDTADSYDVPAFHGRSTEDEFMRWDFFVRHFADEALQKADPNCGDPSQGRNWKDVLYPRAGTLGGCTSHNAMILLYPHDADWTQIAEEDVPFCNIEELTLVVSNASITAGDAYFFPLSFQPPEPDRRAAGRAGEVCLPDPQGGFSGTAHYTDHAVTEMDWSWSGTVQFAPDEQFPQATPWFPEFFDETWDQAVPESGSVMIGGTGFTRAPWATFATAANWSINA